MERKIEELLVGAGADLSGDELPLPPDHVVDPDFFLRPGGDLTPELYAGYERGLFQVTYGGDGYVGQAQYYQGKDSVVELEAPEVLTPNQIYFNGAWFSRRENAKHARDTANYEDYIALVYSARTVNAVLASASGEPYRVQVTLDGAFLTERNKGADVRLGGDGESYVLVSEPRMYSIVETPSYLRHQRLRLSSNFSAFTLFAFTFGGYREGP